MSRVGEIGERSLVQLIHRTFAPVAGKALAPDDDAAVVEAGPGLQVWTVDRQRAGVHFQVDWLSAAEIGARAVNAAASDVWAMGGSPRWLLCALELPADLELAQLELLLGGVRQGAQRIGASVIGGDVGVGSSLGLTTTVGGVMAPDVEPVRRNGARVGDDLWLAGALGWAGLGRHLLETGHPAKTSEARSCVAAFRTPRPPGAFGIAAAAAGVAHAMMDVSDGLALDLRRLCERSGVGARLDAAALVDPVLAAAAESCSADPLPYALGGGEDYAFLLAADRGSEASVRRAAEGGPLRRIGSVQAADAGIELGYPDRVEALPAAGWDPFQAAAP